MTIYDLLAPIYNAWARMTEAEPHRRALAFSRRYACQDLLEVAIGTGTELADLSPDPGPGLRVGLDLSASMLKRAQRRIGLAPSGRALLCRADARSLPFRTASFDCLLSCYFIDLLPDSDIPLVLRECVACCAARAPLCL